MSLTNENEEHDDDGKDQDYLLTKEENLVLLEILCLDLENICHKIEENFIASNNSSF